MGQLLGTGVLEKGGICMSVFGLILRYPLDGIGSRPGFLYIIERETKPY